ncbi:unnamed protein product [Closterium sp. NIES-53]
MTTLRLLLHVAAHRDYELHSLDFSTAFLQGSLHEEIWLRRPPGFTGSFPPGTQWSLRRPVYGLRQAPRRHLATFTRRPGSSLYTLSTESPPVPASGQVAASSQVFAAASGSGPESAPCSCRLLSHQTLLWHHRLGHPSLPRLRGMASRVLGHERYFLLVVDDYSRYTMVFPLRSKGDVTKVLIDWIRAARLQLRESFGSDFLVLRLHSDRGGEFSSARLGAFCRAQGIRQTFTLLASPQQNGIAERRIGMVMDVARTSLIHAAAPHFLWPFAVQYAAHQLNLQPRVSLPETSPTLRWTGKVGDASAFRVWGSRAFVRDLSADKLSPCAVPCVFLGFPPDAPGWQFYHPTSRRVLSSQDVTFDESVPYYRFFPNRTALLPSPPLFLAPGPPPVDPLPPQGRAPSGVSQVDAVEPVEVAVDSGAARGAARGAGSGGAESGGAEPVGAGSKGAEPGGAESGGAELGGAETGGVALGGAESARVAARGTRAAGAGGSPVTPGPGGARTGGTGAVGTGGAAAAAGVGPAGASGAAGAGATGGVGAGVGATGASGAAGAGAAGGVGTGVGPAGGAAESAGGTGASGPTGVGAGGAGGVAGTRAVLVGTACPPRPRPYFVPLLEQVLGLPPSPGPSPPLECPQPVQSQSPLQPVSPLPAPSPHAGPTGGLAERREPASCPVSPVRTTPTSRRAPRPRLPAVPGTHQMTLRPSTAPLGLPLPSPPDSSLPVLADPTSESLRAASPTVARLLSTVVTDPSFASTVASALVAELVDFAARCRLDYAASLVAESASVCPPSVGGECALSTDVLEDRQEEFQCFAAALPHLVSTLIAPEGDPDAPDIPTPRSYAEAIEGPYSSQWQSAMDAQMASWKSTGTYGERPPGSPPVFKARYVARGFNQRQGVDYFQTFSPTPKMTTLRGLLHVAALSDYELHSLDFSTAFLQGSLHEEIWLRRPPGFTGSFPLGTQWSLRRPVYSLRQAPREWHDTLRTTLAALGFVPSTADPSLFLRTDTSLPPFYILVYVDDLVFATADTAGLAHVKSELQKRHTCTDLGELRSYLGLQITRDRAQHTITLTQSHMVQQLYLLSDSRDSVMLFDHTSGDAPAPPATADSATRSQWLTRDTAAHLSIRNHMPLAKCAHFGQHRTAQVLYDAVVARYSSPAAATLGRPLLPYLFPELSAFATVEDLVSHFCTSDACYRAAQPAEYLAKNPPPLYITLYFIVTRLPDSLRAVRDHFLTLDPTALTVDLLEQHLLATQTSVVADVGAASACAKRRSSKGKGGRGGGGGSRGGGGGNSGGGGGSGGGGSGGSGGGSGGFGGGGGGSGGSGGSGSGGSGGGRTGATQQGSGGGKRQKQQRRSKTPSPQQLHEWFAQRGASGGSVSCPYVIRTVAIFDLNYDAILAAMYALSVSVEGDCYLCVPPDPGIDVAALGAGESFLPGTVPAKALHTFTLDSRASHYFFCDSTTLTPLSAPVPVMLADPSGGPVLARSSTVLQCPAVPSGSLSGLHLPSFSTNLVSTAALYYAMVTTTTPGGQHVSICTCTRTGRHLATFTRWPGLSLYTLATEPPQVAASAQVSASGQVAPPCSCHLLTHQTLLWHHRLGHPSLPRLRGMQTRLLVSGLPRSLPPLPPSPAPPCLPCVEGRQRATPHSSSFPPTAAPLQTLHMDMWGPARVSGEGRERYFLLIVDDYTRYTTVFPLHSKGQVIDVLIPWIRAVRLQLRERFRTDLPILRQHSDREGEFSSDLVRDFCRGEGILQSFTLLESPQQNGIAERRMGLVMEVARTSMIHAAAPHFLWPFAVWCVAHQLNLWPRVSLPKTSPTLRWTGKVGDASVFRVWGSRAFVRDTSADKLSARTIPCFFRGFSPDVPSWQFYHPTSRRVFFSHDVTFDKSVPFYRLFPYRSAPPPPPPLFLALGPLPVDPLPPQGPAPSGVACGGAASGGAERGGAEPGGAESEGAGSGGAVPGAEESEGAGSGGAEPGGAEPGGSEPAGVKPGGTVSRGAESRATGAGDFAAGDTGAGGTGGTAGAGGTRGAAAAGLGGAHTGGTSAGGARARGAGVVDPGAVGAGARGTGAGGDGVVDHGVGGAGGTVPPRPYFVPLLQQSKPSLQLASPLRAPSPYTEQTGGLTERREPASRPASPFRTGRRVPCPRPPHVLGKHAMTLRPSSVPLRVLLPPPPECTLPAAHDPESDRARAASPTISRILATIVTDPSFESAAASAIVAELTASPPSIGGECALGMNILKDRQEDFECLVAAVPRFASMLLAPEGDPDAPNIPTPRSYTEAIMGPYSSQWQSAMDAEMAS